MGRHASRDRRNPPRRRPSVAAQFRATRAITIGAPQRRGSEAPSERALILHTRRLRAKTSPVPLQRFAIRVDGRAVPPGDELPPPPARRGWEKVPGIRAGKARTRRHSPPEPWSCRPVRSASRRRRRAPSRARATLSITRIGRSWRSNLPASSVSTPASRTTSPTGRSPSNRAITADLARTGCAVRALAPRERGAQTGRAGRQGGSHVRAGHRR